MKTKWYVTFHTDVLFRTPKKIYYYIVCDSESLAKNVASDIYSLDGVKYLRISTNIRLNGRKRVDMKLWDSDKNMFKNYKWFD